MGGGGSGEKWYRDHPFLPVVLSSFCCKVAKRGHPNSLGLEPLVGHSTGPHLMVSSWTHCRRQSRSLSAVAFRVNRSCHGRESLTQRARGWGETYGAALDPPLGQRAVRKAWWGWSSHHHSSVSGVPVQPGMSTRPSLIGILPAPCTLRVEIKSHMRIAHKPNRGENLMGVAPNETQYASTERKILRIIWDIL